MAGEPDAVYFHDEDYASIGRRIGAFLLDHVFLFLVLILIELAALTLSLRSVPPDLREQMTSTDRAERQLAIEEWMKSAEAMASFRRGLAVWLAFGFVYYVAIRRLRGGTLGYRIMGIRLADKTGNPPSLLRLSGRFFLAAIATFPLGASYITCRTQGRRQSFHDRWCSTWMVRKRAIPAGPATVQYGGFIFGRFILNYTVVEPVHPNDLVGGGEGDSRA